MRQLELPDTTVFIQDANNPRRAIIRFGREKHELYLDPFNDETLDWFWSQSNQARREYVVSHCNRHHRKPGIQGGKSNFRNMKFVLISAHEQYNLLIDLTKTYFHYEDVSKVLPENIVFVFSMIYPFARGFVSIVGGSRPPEEAARLLSDWIDPDYVVIALVTGNGPAFGIRKR